MFVLVGFAGSVTITRLFLEWTGYPQLAVGEFHIAHVLWGGLLLFAAALLLLIWCGRRVASLSSLLTGIGFGLFIDEVGKFITQSNDYFYPLAAPIIYAFFLLTLAIYLRIRRAPIGHGRPALYAIVELLERGVDPGLNDEAYEDIRSQLRLAATTPDPAAARLAQYGLAFLQEELRQPGVAPQRPPAAWWAQTWSRVDRWLTQPRLKRALTAGFGLFALRGMASALAAFFFVIAVANPARWQQMGATSTPLSAAAPFSAIHLILVSITLVAEGLIGALFLAASGALATDRVRRGLTFGYWGLLFSLTAVRFLVFYFNQFDLLLTTLLQATLLLGVLHYRARHLGLSPVT